MRKLREPRNEFERGILEELAKRKNVKVCYSGPKIGFEEEEGEEGEGVQGTKGLWRVGRGSTDYVSSILYGTLTVLHLVEGSSRNEEMAEWVVEKLNRAEEGKELGSYGA